MAVKEGKRRNGYDLGRPVQRAAGDVASGISRGWRRTEKTLAWHDVRAFCVHWYKSGFSTWTAYTYMLMSDTETFVWTIPANATPDVRVASGVLAQVAAARTNCPLCDVTFSADLLSAWEAPVSSKPRAYPNDGEPRRLLVAALTAVRESAPRQPVPFRPVGFSSRSYWLNALVMIGTMCYAYANGQLLGSVHDPYAFPPAPPFWLRGLQVLTLAPLTFNDFAIYSSPPPYQPLLSGL